MLITSHSTFVLKTFCTRAVILEGGKIVSDGSPEQVCMDYDTVDLGTDESLLKYAGEGVP